jgi:DNA-binding CsgD family transcriptional regulator
MFRASGDHIRYQLAADRLFIYRATVRTDLTHVFTKLDITNRAQLTALVTRATAESARGRS